LDQFKTRLQEWPQYCTFLAQIPHLRQAHPKLMEWVDKVSSHAEPPLRCPLNKLVPHRRLRRLTLLLRANPWILQEREQLEEQ
jgi:hypothetical protein